MSSKDKDNATAMAEDQTPAQNQQVCWPIPDLGRLPKEVTAEDEVLYDRIVGINLTPEQEAAIVTPALVQARESAVLAVHWHPETIPLDLILRRIDATFPAASHKLIIPTQHNEIIRIGDFAGVEVDCFSQEFNTKVQLLLHFRAERVQSAGVLKSMIAHTFSYRSSQLFEFLDTILMPHYENRLETAARRIGMDEPIIDFIRIFADKLKQLITAKEAETPPAWIKNKLLREFFDGLRPTFGDRLIDRCQVFLKEVKAIVKANFNPGYFYRTREMIDEARANGAGIIVPHPEQFWPILLADYDIDGYEVWNPQSRQYTEFLIGSVQRLNRSKSRRERPLLITMGDDCHMGEKARPLSQQDPVKAEREIGYQPAWNELAIRKVLGRYDITKESVLEAYKSRLV